MVLHMEAVVGETSRIPVLGRLRFSSREPYSVFLDNHIDLPRPVTWVLSRELLSEGLHTPVGQGDVSVFPDRPEQAQVLYLILRGLDVAAVLRLPAADVRRFLNMANRIVPKGREGEHLDLDGLLALLLRPEPPV
ncbi:SsgA family sporulation/cell division regulator [Kitasatospora sp. MMS16-BH015]|uniref:SsgA family sporulation/cell division regulator n=1 Tax=Kitasatospora sp. MMS16-BH015 TaxID=2018025 RepID=UPI00131A4A03|nr:SsgA family sporulation/cell division regulator [Kitasatospora sp. MMS16-BH015]